MGEEEAGPTPLWTADSPLLSFLVTSLALPPESGLQLSPACRPQLSWIQYLRHYVILRNGYLRISEEGCPVIEYSEYHG